MKWKLILIIMGIGVLIVGGLFALNKMQVTSLLPESESGIVLASSFNPLDTREIGYEFLDDDKVVHIWNTQDDYFFNRSSGIQLTNHFQDYWTRNIFCLGYYNGGEWNKINCADELSGFSRNIQTDDETYVNATLWKDISYGNYDMRLGINYYLGLNDKNLSITIYGKNIGIDIPFDIGFAWKITKWDIPPSESNDYIKVNNTNYLISSFNDDIMFNEVDNTFIKGFDNREHLRVDWDENLNYAVKMFGDGIIENFYVALLINAGTFSAGQEKSTTFYWIDAIAVDDTSDGTDAGTASLTVAHTTSGTATNGILIVTVQVTDASETDRIINNVTYNNVELTHLAGADADDDIEQRAEIWYLTNPEETTANIVVTADGSCTDLTLGAISLTGVNTTASTFVVQTAEHPNTGPPTLDITTVGDSSYVVDSLAIAESDGTKIATGTAGGQVIHKTDVGGDTHAVTYVDAGGAGVQTMNYTDTDSDKSWVLSAVAIRMNNLPTVYLNTSNEAVLTNVTPTLQFTGIDLEGDEIEYNLQVDTVNTFDSQGSSPILLDSYSEDNVADYHNLYSSSKTIVGQAFTNTNVVTLGSTRFYMMIGNGNPTGNVYSKIYDITETYGTNATPTGTALATSDPVDATTLPIYGSPELVTFSFSGVEQISLSASSYYIVTVEYDDTDDPNRISVGYDGSSSTHDGNYMYYISPTWYPNAYDLAFYVYDNSSTYPLLDKFSITPDATFNGTSGDPHPWASGVKINYTVQTGDALSEDTTYFWRVRGSDGAYGDWSEIRNFTISGADTASPKWFDNSTNSTVAGTFVKHNVRWTDAGLSGYIFSFDNGTGTFTNDTWTSMTGTNNWSNVSKIVNSTIGSTIQWRVYANDTASPSNWNQTSVFQYDTTSAQCWAEITGGLYVPSGCTYYIPSGGAYIT